MRDFNTLYAFFALVVSIIGVIVAIVIYIHSKKTKEKEIEKINEIIKNYDELLSDESFLEWQNKVFKCYYGEEYFTKVCNRDYPAYCFPNIDDSNYSFDGLCNVKNLKNDRKEFNFKKMKHYKAYKNIEEPDLLDRDKRKVRFPERYGFMLDELELNNDSNIRSFTAWVGKFKDNVYTSHILEYELYYLYKNYRKSNLDLIISKMKLRNRIHNIKNSNNELKMKNFKYELSIGHNRGSLIIVQMMIIIKDHEDGEYKVLTIKRANNVADRPGFFQFVPTGGFEVLEGVDNINEQFSVEYALLREYAEELFGQDFDEMGGNTITQLKKNKYVKTIEEMIAQGKANLYFLGSIVGLVSLKHELSFVLIIKDEGYSENVIFNPCEIEIRKKEIIKYAFTEIEEKIAGPKFNPPSAALYRLFKESKLYREISTESKTST